MLGIYGFLSEVYQTFKDEIATILCKLLKKIEKEETLPNSFYEAKITLANMLPKLTNWQRKYHTNIPHESTHKKKTPGKSNSAIHKKNYRS